LSLHDALPICFLLRGFNQSHLLIETFPSLAVENQAIDPRPQSRIHRLRKIVLPPKIKRQVGIEMGENYARQQFYAWSLEQKRNLLGANLFAPGAADVAMRVDPGFDSVLF